MSTTELANLFASKFIARPDVKAVQFSNGKWSPHQEYNEGSGKHDGPRIPWRREDLEAHIGGSRTFGHYLLGQESDCKLFAFDIDLAKTGTVPDADPFTSEDEPSWSEVADLRSWWLDRSNPGRSQIKYDFKRIATLLLSAISDHLELPCAAAYSGAKGIHVYAFTGRIPAHKAFDGAKLVLDLVPGFQPLRGEHFFTHTDFPNFEIEIFPKQASLEGKDLGNLMRLPLGKNNKAPQEPAFFLEMLSPLAEFKPCDPIDALTRSNPWNLA